MLLRVQHLVPQTAPLEHPRHLLRDVDARRTHEDRKASAVQALDLVEQLRVLLALGAEHDIVVVHSADRPVRRNDLDLETVDLVKLGFLRLRRPGHAGQLVVHAEVVLDRDRSERLRLLADDRAFLRLDRLMEPVAPPASLHLPPGELVDDDHVAVLDHVLHVLLVQRMRLHELVDHVNLLGLFRVLPLELLDAVSLVVDRRLLVVLDLLDRLRYVRHDEGIGVAGTEDVEAAIADLDRVPLLIHREEEELVDLVQALLAHQVRLGALNELLHALLREQLHEATVLGCPALGGQQLLAGLPLQRRIGLFVIQLLEQPLSVRHELADDPPLLPDEAGDLRVVALVDVLIAGPAGRAADDERRAGLVDENGVDLVDDRVEMAALHAILQPHDHVVAQVVEPVLVVGPVRDIALVGRPSLGSAGRGIVETTHGEPEELEHRAHPLRVAPGQVVVDRDEVGAATGQRVQVERHGGDESLAFSGRHLRDLALMQDDGADELHVVRDHVPRHLVAGDDDLVAEEPAARLADRRERLGKDLVQHLTRGLVQIGLGIGHPLREAFALGQIFGVPALVAQRLDRALVLSELLVDRLAEPLRLAGQLFVRRR